MYKKIGDLYAQDSSWEDALDYFLSAHGIFRTILERNPDRTALVWNLAGLSNQIGILLLDLDRSVEAREYLGESVGILEPLTEKDPENVQIRLDLVGAYLNTISSFGEEDQGESRA